MKKPLLEVGMYLILYVTAYKIQQRVFKKLIGSIINLYHGKLR